MSPDHSRRADQPKKKTLTQPHCKPVSHEVLVENHTKFFPVSRAFAPGALRESGWVKVAGSVNFAWLFIIVEYDARSVVAGYHWEGGVGDPRVNPRVKAGWEEWFWTRDLISTRLGERHERSENFRDQRDAWENSYAAAAPKPLEEEEHDVILDAARRAQAILDAAADSPTDAVKNQVRALFDPQAA